MIRPLDIQTAFNALPEIGRLNFADQASTMYRQVQELGHARMENLIRPERVQEAASRSAVVFPPINQLDEKVRWREKKNQEKTERKQQLRELYAPAGMRSRRRAEITGEFVDMSA